MECKQQENLIRCNCSYPGCFRKGLCCECIAFHRSKRQVPGCFFPSEEEANWDRSYEHFASLVNEKKI